MAAGPPPGGSGAAGPPILELREVRAGYGSIEALHGISLRVRAGEIVALIGANGAGKSTTLRTIQGLLPAWDGEVLFEGKPVGGMRPDQLVAMGIAHAPEGRLVFPRMSVEENLQMGAFQRRDREGIRADEEEVLRIFPRLRERLSQAAGTLSGGEQQMLAIGRALMARPRLLLLDEPSMGLAPVLVEQIFEVIADLRRRGATILLVEQNAHMALSIADRGYVLETGRVVLEGPGRELLASETVRKSYLGVEE